MNFDKASLEFVEFFVHGYEALLYCPLEYQGGEWNGLFWRFSRLLKQELNEFADALGDLAGDQARPILWADVSRDIANISSETVTLEMQADLFQSHIVSPFWTA